METNIKRVREDLVLDIIVLILAFVVLISVLYPLIFVVSASFSNPSEVLKGKVWLLPKGFTLDSYKIVFSNKEILTGYKNTILYTSVGVIVNLIMTIFAAYPLSRKDLQGRNLITAFFAFTMFFSGGLIPTYLVIKQLGLVDNFWVMILPTAVSMWNVVIMRTFFENSIPYELQEAAFIDGCSNIKILTTIILPLSTSIIAVMVIFYGVAHWNAFFNALIYLSNENKYPLQMILRQILIENQTDSMMQAGAGSEVTSKRLMIYEGLKYAVVIVASVPMLLLYPFAQKYFIKGVMIGAIKG